ncbi:MAG: YggS family pyridoxal phosphate-dependent enzyme, partial [Nitrospirota bacterium]|nr:YggS family pyridoxal phosphate-dependent enzyme [Nitrospirota bacterium]
MDEIQLFDNLKEICRRMAQAAMRAGREPSEITLIAVTKNVHIDVIRKALDSGLREFGENRVQEAQKKIASGELRAGGGALVWHLIGHLQKNKAKTAVKLFDLIHSVDSQELAEELDRQAAKIEKVQRILVQVKLSEEETKQGVEADDFYPLIGRIAALKHVKLEGLMTMPPYFEEPERARPYFRRLAELK